MEKRYTESEIETEIIELRKEGMYINKISEKLGIPLRSVQYILKKNKIKVKNATQRNTMDREKQILKLKEQGMSIIEIQKKLDVSQNAVYQALSRNKSGLIKNTEKSTEKLKTEKVEITPKKEEKNEKIEENKLSTTIKNMYESKQEIDIEELDSLLKNNNYNITAQELKLVLKLYTRQKNIKEAKKLIENIKNSESESKLEEKTLEQIEKALLIHELKTNIVQLTKEHKTVEEISMILNVKEETVIKLKNEIIRKNVERGEI